MKFKQIALAAVFALVASAPALADVNIGVSVSATGPAAALGIAEKNTISLLPTEIGGEKVIYHVLDDASDTTTAVTNTRKFITERNVDAIVGSSTTPNSLAMIDVAAEAKTPIISMAGSAIVVEPQDGKNNKRWAFKTPQNDALMAGAVAAHMKKQGVKTVGFIGFSDAYGEGWYDEAKKAIEAAGMEMVASERYGRTDTSVTGQVLKLMALNPDAVLVGASGTPAALPETTLKERGYKGQMYQTHGVAIRDFLRVGGKDVEGTFLPAGPVLVADQLPDSNPVKASALEYINAYEAKYGEGTVSTFGGHAWDAGRLLSAAIPVALEKAEPGSEEFRVALRDALENVHDVAGAQGVFDMSPTDHTGLDERAVVMVKIENGDWVYQPD
ncbi:MAG: ABC transporter substrate-binding protein [Ottowia sp.]|nr:ABC transporter substrate-binding protein [Ottowia sp.]